MAGTASCDFMQAVFTILFHTVMKCGLLMSCLTFFLYMFFFPISMVATGIIYKDSCPAEPYFPIYMIIYGTLGFLRSLFYFPRTKVAYVYNVVCSRIDSLLTILYIIGLLLVMKMYPPNYEDINCSTYCNEVLYKLLLVHVAMYYGWLALKGFLCSSNGFIDHK